MFPSKPRVLIDNKVLDATEVHAIVVKTTLKQLDTAEVIVMSPLQIPTPIYRLGADLQIRLPFGDAIFAGRINGISPRAGIRQWLIRAHGPMGSVQPARARDARIEPPIKSLTLGVPYLIQGNKQWVRAKLTLDPEVDSVKFHLGDTKYVNGGPGWRSFTGSIENIERRYGQFGGDLMTLDVAGSLPESSLR